MNFQKPERTREEGLLEVNSLFDTIQGEGPFAGQPAIFLRLAGCNLQCPLCDTEYTERLEMSIEDILRNMGRSHRGQKKLVVITGGEPFRQSIGPLVRALHENDYRVQIETNGTIFRHGPWALAHIVCSPKIGKIHPDLVPYISCYKYVLRADAVDPTDGLPTYVLGMQAHVARPPTYDGRPIYLQPADEGTKFLNERNLQATIESCMKHGYTLCLQLHKLIGVP